MFYKIDSKLLPSVRMVGRTNLKAPYFSKKQAADEYVLYFIIEGAMHLVENGSDLELLPGDLYILEPNHIYTGGRASECEYYYIYFTHPAFTGIKELDNALKNVIGKQRRLSLQSSHYSYDMCLDTIMYLPGQYHFDSRHSMLEVSGILDEAIRWNSIQMEYYKILCACRIQEMFVWLCRNYTSTEVLALSETLPKSYLVVQELLCYLNSEFGEKINSSLLEEKFRYNFDFMNRIFKQITGITIFTYLTDVRIDCAKMLLIDSALTVADVGRESGFPDEYYFSRVFKRYTGMSPTGYKKSHMKGIRHEISAE